jgi:hypothetical protein
MNESSDRVDRWVQMWLDSSPEEAATPVNKAGSNSHRVQDQWAGDEDFENNGLVIMQRLFMKAYAKMSPAEREKLRARAPAYTKKTS